MLGSDAGRFQGGGALVKNVRTRQRPAFGGAITQMYSLSIPYH